jgi:hypothetical protein
LGWAGLGWAGLGCAALGWAALGCGAAGLGWAGPGCARRGWAALGWAGLGWAGLSCIKLGWDDLPGQHGLLRLPGLPALPGWLAGLIPWPRHVNPTLGSSFPLPFGLSPRKSFPIPFAFPLPFFCFLHSKIVKANSPFNNSLAHDGDRKVSWARQCFRGNHRKVSWACQC